jgi:hypothetical protein
MRILEAQKHVDPVDPDPQHCLEESRMHCKKGCASAEVTVPGSWLDT